jgi:hypothetical protein
VKCPGVRQAPGRIDEVSGVLLDIVDNVVGCLVDQVLYFCNFQDFGL